MITRSWTIMTWIVVVGSTLVMLLWILIYSFFMSTDFVDEVLILFGGVQFWVTVLITALLALGTYIVFRSFERDNLHISPFYFLAPRFTVKFVSTVFFPLDKDIVREMWVMGNLKDRLGIKHRKEKKDRGPSPRNLEAAPMIHEQHTRSTSELSAHHTYESALAVAIAPEIGTSQYSLPSELLLSSTKQDSQSSLTPMPPTSPTRFDNVSPQLSYYSASDIPRSSPLPPTLYKLASGEITTTPSTPKSTRNSMHLPSKNVSLQLPSSQRPASGLLRRLSRSSSRGRHEEPGGAFEMRSLQPPEHYPQLQPRRPQHRDRDSRVLSASSFATHTSYETVEDEFWTSEHYGGMNGGGDESSSQPGVQRMSQVSSSWHGRDSEEITRAGDREGTTLGHGAGQQHDRPTSDISVKTWVMGRAL